MSCAASRKSVETRGEPGDFEMREIGVQSRSLCVEFDPVLEEGMNYYGMLNGEITDSIQLRSDGFPKKWSVSSLVPDSQYVVQIMASNEDGERKVSNKLVIHTTYDRYPHGYRNNAGQLLHACSGRTFLSQITNLLIGDAHPQVIAGRHRIGPRFSLEHTLATCLRKQQRKTMHRDPELLCSGSNVVTLRDDIYICDHGEIGLAYYPVSFAARLQVMLVLSAHPDSALCGLPIRTLWRDLMQGFVYFECIRLMVENLILE